MEIYTNTGGQTVYLEAGVAPDDIDSIDVNIYQDDRLLSTIGTIPYVDGRYTFVFPLFLTDRVRELRIVWRIIYTDTAEHVLKANTFVSVVMPLVDVKTARTELDIGSDVSDEQIRLVERRVRSMIETLTGQQFAPYEATLLGTELSDGSVRLPQKMLALVSVNGISNAMYYTLGGDGWRLNIQYPRKRDGFRAIGGEVPIINPFSRWEPKKAAPVRVVGRWGYERVPEDIKEAALILIEQQLCPDALYRERYIKTMTAADMRFEFSPGAYAGTGNVVADQILSKYVQSNAAVI